MKPKRSNWKAALELRRRAKTWAEKVPERFLSLEQNAEELTSRRIERICHQEAKAVIGLTGNA